MYVIKALINVQEMLACISISCGCHWDSETLDLVNYCHGFTSRCVCNILY